MKQNKIAILISFFVITILACTSNDILNIGVQPTPTATVILARFATSTNTVEPPPAESSEVEPTETNTSEPSPTPDDAVSATEEATAEIEDDEATTFESPLATPTPEDTPTSDASPTPTVPSPPPTATPTDTPVPTPAPLAGRIAFPVDNGGGRYDIWVVELPDGEPFTVLNGARQPNFSDDGRLLVNLQASDFGQSIGLMDANYAWQGVINNSPDDAYPFWQPGGNIYTYSNPKLLIDPLTGGPLPHVFIPCSLQLPNFETEEKCKDIQGRGKVVIGEAPVWTEDDRIAFFTYEGDDGIYVVSSVSALWEAGGVGSTQLLVTGNGRPSDTDGFQVFFSAGTIDGNWEAYSIDLDGNNLVNLSNAPSFQDGLPTVSPDGNWIAFVSDRDGKWGIWALPRTGGEPTKLVDISTINTNPSPWGVGENDWTNERISWGP